MMTGAAAVNGLPTGPAVEVGVVLPAAGEVLITMGGTAGDEGVAGADRPVGVCVGLIGAAAMLLTGPACGAALEPTRLVAPTCAVPAVVDAQPASAIKPTAANMAIIA